MKTQTLPALLLLALFGIVANAQQSDFGGRSIDGIASDYRQVGVVAHVRIKDIKLAAPDIHPLYAVESETVEIFKGEIKKGAPFTFYFHAEETYDVRKLIGKEWVVFLEGKSPDPAKKKVWHELENSKLPASPELSGKLRQFGKKKPKKAPKAKTKSAG